MYIMSLQSVQIAVSGMTCGNCARTVERKLSSTPGVSRVEVDLPGARATVEFDPERTSTAQLAAAIEQLGYKASA